MILHLALALSMLTRQGRREGQGGRVPLGPVAGGGGAASVNFEGITVIPGLGGGSYIGYNGKDSTKFNTNDYSGGKGAFGITPALAVSTGGSGGGSSIQGGQGGNNSAGGNGIYGSGGGGGSGGVGINFATVYNGYNGGNGGNGYIKFILY